MKTKILTVVVALFALVLFPAAVRAADITVTIDGERVHFEGQQPVIVDGRTLVPVRSVFEQLGFDVGWDNETQQVSLERHSAGHIVLTIGSAEFKNFSRHQDGGSFALDVSAQIIGGSTMIPLRAVLENIGIHLLDWDVETQTVVILRTYRHLNSSNLSNEDIENLRYMVHLRDLFLGDNQLSDLTSLEELTNLTRLALGYNQIGNLMPLANLTNLSSLHLQDNQISDLTPLAGLTNLWHLELDNNQITDLTPLAGLTNLAILSLHGNQITDWSPVAHIEIVHGRP